MRDDGLRGDADAMGGLAPGDTDAALPATTDESPTAVLPAVDEAPAAELREALDIPEWVSEIRRLYVEPKHPVSEEGNARHRRTSFVRRARRGRSAPESPAPLPPPSPEPVVAVDPAPTHARGLAALAGFDEDLPVGTSSFDAHHALPAVDHSAAEDDEAQPHEYDDAADSAQAAGRLTAYLDASSAARSHDTHSTPEDEPVDPLSEDEPAGLAGASTSADEAPFPVEDGHAVEEGDEVRAVATDTGLLPASELVAEVEPVGEMPTVADAEPAAPDAGSEVSAELDRSISGVDVRDATPEVEVDPTVLAADEDVDAGAPAEDISDVDPLIEQPPGAGTAVDETTAELPVADEVEADASVAEGVPADGDSIDESLTVADEVESDASVAEGVPADGGSIDESLTVADEVEADASVAEAVPADGGSIDETSETAEALPEADVQLTEPEIAQADADDADDADDAVDASAGSVDASADALEAPAGSVGPLSDLDAEPLDSVAVLPDADAVDADGVESLDSSDDTVGEAASTRRDEVADLEEAWRRPAHDRGATEPVEPADDALVESATAAGVLDQAVDTQGDDDLAEREPVGDAVDSAAEAGTLDDDLDDIEVDAEPVGDSEATVDAAGLDDEVVQREPAGKDVDAAADTDEDDDDTDELAAGAELAVESDTPVDAAGLDDEVVEREPEVSAVEAAVDGDADESEVDAAGLDAPTSDGVLTPAEEQTALAATDVDLDAPAKGRDETDVPAAKAAADDLETEAAPEADVATALGSEAAGSVVADEDEAVDADTAVAAVDDGTAITDADEDTDAAEAEAPGHVGVAAALAAPSAGHPSLVDDDVDLEYHPPPVHLSWRQSDSLDFDVPDVDDPTNDILIEAPSQLVAPARRRHHDPARFVQEETPEQEPVTLVEVPDDLPATRASLRAAAREQTPKGRAGKWVAVAAVALLVVIAAVWFLVRDSGTGAAASPARASSVATALVTAGAVMASPQR